MSGPVLLTVPAWLAYPEEYNCIKRSLFHNCRNSSLTLDLKTVPTVHNLLNRSTRCKWIYKNHKQYVVRQKEMLFMQFSSGSGFTFQSSHKLKNQCNLQPVMPRKNIFVLVIPRSSSFLHPCHPSLTINFLGSQMDGVPITKARQK